MSIPVKFFRGSSANLPDEITNGAIYFTSEGTVFVDVSDTERVSFGGSADMEIGDFSELNPVILPYLLFEEESGKNFVVNWPIREWDGSMEYSLDGVTWKLCSPFDDDPDTTIDGMIVSGKLYLRGTNNTFLANRGSYSTINFLAQDDEEVRIKCIGNIETLLDWQLVVNRQHPIMGGTGFAYLFENCTSLVQAPELPAMTLIERCYSGMFKGCTSLVQAPELPAMTLADYCYQYMFYGCTSLVQPPQLPATTLADYCYFSMFKGCTLLAKLPKITAMTLPSYCCREMFNGCSLIKLSETQVDEYQTPYCVVIGDGTTAALFGEGMFQNTGGTYQGVLNPIIQMYMIKSNTTYYTSNEVIG